MAEQEKIDLGLRSVDVERKDFTLKDLSRNIDETLSNPPQSPIEAARWMGGIIDQMVSFSDGGAGSVSSALSSIIPGVGAILPAISGIVGLFSGASMPSFEEVTLKALGQLSSQISAGFADLKATFKADLEAHSRLVIDTVLQGIDTAQLEVSAVNVFRALNEIDIIDDLITAQKQDFDMIMQDLEDDASAVLEDLDEQAQAMRDALEAEYKQYSEMSFTMLSPFFACVAKKIEHEENDSGLSFQARSTESTAGGGNSVLVIGGAAAAVAALLLFGKDRKK